MDDPHEQPDGGRLARPVRAEETEDLAFRNVKVQVEEPVPRTVVLGADRASRSRWSSAPPLAYHARQATLGVMSEVQRILDAIFAISSDLELSAVLERIVEVACDETGARYGALGVLAAA